MMVAMVGAWMRGHRGRLRVLATVVALACGGCGLVARAQSDSPRVTSAAEAVFIDWAVRQVRDLSDEPVIAMTLTFSELQVTTRGVEVTHEWSVLPQDVARMLGEGPPRPELGELNPSRFSPHDVATNWQQFRKLNPGCPASSVIMSGEATWSGVLSAQLTCFSEQPVVEQQYLAYWLVRPITSVRDRGALTTLMRDLTNSQPEGGVSQLVIHPQLEGHRCGGDAIFPGVETMVTQRRFCDVPAGESLLPGVSADVEVPDAAELPPDAPLFDLSQVKVDGLTLVLNRTGLAGLQLSVNAVRVGWSAEHQAVTIQAITDGEPRHFDLAGKPL